MINTELKHFINIALEEVVRKELNIGIGVKLQESKAIKLIADAILYIILYIES